MSSRLLTPEEKQAFERRKEIALAQFGIFIGVVSSWSRQYGDDDKKADMKWITQVIEKTEKPLEVEPKLKREWKPEYPQGWLFDNRKHPALGWMIGGDGVWRLYSAVEFKPNLTRKEFRELAERCGVELPFCHTTIWLDEPKASADEKETP